MVSNKFKFKINRHFEENYILYAIIVFALTLGISVGALLSGVLKTPDKQGLVKYLSFLFDSLKTSDLDVAILIKHSLLTNIKTILLIWILGITIIGGPFTIVIIAYRGFILGFTTSLLFTEFGIKGIMIALFAILPQNLFIVTGLIIISSITLNYSFKFLKKNKVSRYQNKSMYLNKVFSYTINILIFSSLIIIGSLIEGYITPLLLKILY